MASIDLTINVDEVIDATTRIKRVESALVGATAVSAINKVLPRTYDSAAKKMLSGINLPRSDLDDQMSIEKASDPLKPQGAIVASRKTRRPNTMRRYLVGMILANTGPCTETMGGTGTNLPPSLMISLADGATLRSLIARRLSGV